MDASDSSPPLEADVDLTDMLARARNGDRDAWNRLVTLLYSDLRRLAHQHLGSHAGERTLDTTALVHECYIRLAQAAKPNDHGHFLCLASRVMRQVIVDHARERLAQKRGSGVPALPLQDVGEKELAEARQFVALDDALTALASHDARKASVVECRFFGGLTESETADALGVSLRLVQLDWHEARRWLAEILSPD